ncbi:MAG TPA: hypothetical protein VMM93_13570 [Vicinamibacterales bacterium]|nr:hypothetical protein [Vicinamibacterales bacterium]
MRLATLAIVVTALAAAGPSREPARAQAQGLSFFSTSVGPGTGAHLGGLEGADRHCQALAAAVGAGGRTWRAYLSTSAASGQPGVHARDRIGDGPWVNAKGVTVATSVADLHSDANKLSKENLLDEKGDVVNGRGDTPNRHDILTGSQPDGTAGAPGTDTTCGNWTSGGEGSALVGHHDRQGGGANPTSWNSAHASRGCSQENLRGTGGDGLFYCFAAR